MTTSLTPSAKVATVPDMWVGAINNHGGFGPWAFVEVRDPRNAQNDIRQGLSRMASGLA
jgi:hypothetical protein